MDSKNDLHKFNPDQIKTVNNAVSMAEELVSNAYKMSASQWLHPKYDVKTLTNLTTDEIVYGPFAQVIRYVGQHKEASLGSTAYDFYKICLQDHSIIRAMQTSKELRLYPFTLYIVTHELIHIVRFSKFLQSFDASPDEKLAEETRVHKRTHAILNIINIPGLAEVLDFYQNWHAAVD